MIEQDEIEEKVAPALMALGLFSFGWFVMSEAPLAGRPAMMVGNRENDGRHGMWEVFSRSTEFSDGRSDALDRWTRRVVEPIAQTVDAIALFPFGNPVWPFQRYARAATGMQSSPLGILIHPQYGLWHAFRSVLVFNQRIELQAAFPRLDHPCETCSDRPCLSACPVNAFSDEGYQVTACRSHLASGHDPACLTIGCRSRAACPVGQPYGEAQIRFHMAAFAPEDRKSPGNKN